MSIFKKIKEFYQEHHTVINCIGIGILGGVGVGLAIGYSKGHKDGFQYGVGYGYGFKEGCDDVQNLLAESGTKVDVDTELNKLLSDLSDHTPCPNLWKEDYRENYEALDKLAKSMELEDGELYIIEKDSELSDKNIFSHLVNGGQAYPPELEDENDEDTRELNSPLSEG